MPADRGSIPARMDKVTSDVLATLDWSIPGWLTYWGVVGLCGFVWSLAALVWAYQIYSGLHITGLMHPVMWGVYIAAFDFWIGIAHSGTLISAILFLFCGEWRASGAALFLFLVEWRASLARAAETMTLVAVMSAGIFPVLHLGRAWRFYWLIP